MDSLHCEWAREQPNGLTFFANEIFAITSALRSHVVQDKRGFFLHCAEEAFMLIRIIRKPIKNNYARLLPRFLVF